MHHEDDSVDGDLRVELDVESGAVADGDGDAPPPVRVAPDDLAPDTLRAVIESFVLREGTDYGVSETSLDVKVSQVRAQLQRGEAHVVFDPASETVTIVVTRALDDTVI